MFIINTIRLYNYGYHVLLAIFIIITLIIVIIKMTDI